MFQQTELALAVVDLQLSPPVMGLVPATQISVAPVFLPAAIAGMLGLVRATLANSGYPRENGPLIADQDWIDGRQAARLLGL